MNRRVYVVNKSAHDFSAAEKYGELVFLTEGRQRHYDVNNKVAVMAEILNDSNPEDYLVFTSLNTLCAIAAALFALRHGGRLNILLYMPRTGTYAARELRLDQVINCSVEQEPEDELE